MLWLEGAPAVGYRQASFAVQLHQFDGATWGGSVPDPSGGQTTGLFYRAPDFCFDGDRVVMAYAHAGDATADDESFYDRVFAYEYTSSSGWSVLDGGDEVSQHWNAAEQVGYNADDPSVACGPGLDPAVAWIETDLTAEQDDDVFVAQQTGGAFVSSPRINRVAAAGTPALVVDVALDADGAAYVAHFELAADASSRSNLYVTRIAAGTVTALGGAIDTDQDTNALSAPSIVAVAEDDVYVAYSADRTSSGQRDVYVIHWDGNVWSVLGGWPVSAFPSDHSDSGNPDLVLVDTVPVLTWNEASEYEGYFVFVARYADPGWELVCDRLNVDPARSALDPSLLFNAAGSALYAAFEEYVDGSPEILVRRLLLAG
jgi:hypothetical protein